jgi:DTW domain-containing protein YfiP
MPGHRSILPTAHSLARLCHNISPGWPARDVRGTVEAPPLYAYTQPMEPTVECPRCGKPTALCLCETVTPVDSGLSVLILQHPQEQDRLLGTARLTALHFRNAMVKVGLSWPSLAKILGRPVDPHRWAVLYLGSAKAAQLATDRDVVILDRKGEPARDQDRLMRDIEGVVLLDGNWSQVKALWWRNPWMLKCRRVVLTPRRPSRYGRLRREPRRDALSTIEAAAMLTSRIEGRPEIEATLDASFERLLEHYRTMQGQGKSVANSSSKLSGGEASAAKTGTG